ncbi:2-dehydropantoate 2-reductase [Streptomyces sp. SL13]|uniref:2-dehydropantoate 2-reductase n=1 Tax=Streptantibioticus silvisoli TaxID=2705255 RepID=A0AA90H1E6_9ACTN|nr:2-dehydropantoate 2-reductase [Streptantibioticus silvisoli]MDI5969233.1 2-dehydropantoate 2-reductase [Streptantibioticus silvisoli]
MTPPEHRTEPHPRTRPRVVVYGAGSIGCHLGGSLAATADVTLVGREDAMRVIDTEGVTLTGGGRPARHTPAGALRTATGPEAVAGADYVLVTVKSADTAGVARRMAAHLDPGTVVVSFQNGLRNAAVLTTALGGHAVLAGMVPYNVLRDGPGAFHQGSGGALMLDDRPQAADLVTALRAGGLPVQPRTDMREVQHAKLLMNLNNAINALSGLPLRDQLGERSYRACLALCQGEALAAFRAAGVRPARLGTIPAAWTPAVLRLPDALFRRLAGASLRIDAQARSSTWEDLRRGRPTEIDDLQGAVVALAARHGLPAPANSRLITLIRLMEAAGPEQARSWRGPDLLAEIAAPRR